MLAALLAGSYPASAFAVVPPASSPAEPAPAEAPAAPLAAPAVQLTPAQIGAYLQARVASEAGADARASRAFRALLSSPSAGTVIARRALDHGLMAGDWPLALDAARRLEQAGALPPLRRTILLAEAFRERDWAGAERQIAQIEQDEVLAMMAPALRAWRAFGMGRSDAETLLAPMAAGQGASYAAEHRALILLASGRGEIAPFQALAADTSLRAQRLRIAAAAEFAARNQRDQALALVAGDQPALAAARRLIQARRPVPGRIDTAADGVAELLARIAIDLGQQRLGEEGAMLARVAEYLAPDSSQATIIAAESLSEREPATAIRLLARVNDADPFAEAARGLRIGLLSRSGMAERALTEVQARTNRGSRDPSDWIQLGDILMELNRPAEAATAYVRAHALWRAGTYPTIPEWVLWLQRGAALERSGQWPAALAALREAHRLAPEQPLVLNYLGYAQLERGENLEEGERLVREALQRAPDSAAITDSLGWALYMRGRVDEAIPYLERAVRGAPDDVEINDHLGDAYYRVGRRIEARHAWRAALLRADEEDGARIRAKIERGLPTETARR